MDSILTVDARESPARWPYGFSKSESHTYERTRSHSHNHPVPVALDGFHRFVAFGPLYVFLFWYGRSALSSCQGGWGCAGKCQWRIRVPVVAAGSRQILEHQNDAGRSRITVLPVGFLPRQ